MSQAQQRRPRDRRMILATGFLALILILMLILPNLISLSALQIGTKIGLETTPLNINAQRIVSLMVDQESGERGYIITQDEKFLAPYNEGKIHLNDLWAATEQLAAKVGGQAPQLLQDSKDAAMRWQREVGEAEIALVKNGSVEAARQSVENSTGKQLFDDFRIKANVLIDYAEQQRTNQTEQRNQLFGVLNISLIVLGILGLIALATIYYIGQVSRRYQEDIAKSEEIGRAKDEFLSIASHELKTPITSVRGYAQALLRRARKIGDDGPSLEDWQRTIKQLTVIEQQSGRLARMVDDLLDVSRLDTKGIALNREPSDIVLLTQHITEQLQTTTKQHTISLSSESPQIMVNMDDGRIEQVIYNLINNAIKYSPEGMEIKVKLRVEEGEVICAVADRGIGIPKEEQGMLFSRFYRATNAATSKISGVGLGLYIANTIIERHGGRMWVDSQIGHGSTFYFSLPLSDLAHPRRQAMPQFECIARCCSVDIVG